MWIVDDDIMEELPLVSIIIVNYNGKSHLEKCLLSLSKSSYQRFEVILVDNNSTDSSVEFVQKSYPFVDIIKLDKNYGFAEPNNIGAQKAKGEFLLFLNNDTMPTPNFITEMVKIAKENPEIAIFQSLLLKSNGAIDSSGDYMDMYGRAYSSREKVTEIRQILSARGASMMVRNKVFWDLRGFDKNFFVSFEDVDLGLRAWIYGYKVVLVPKSIVYHFGGQTIQKLDSMVSFHGVKNTLILRLTDFEIAFAIKSMTVLFFVSIMRKLFGISVIKDPEQSPALPSFKIIFCGLIWLVKNLDYVISKRRMIKSRRVRSTRELVKMGLITKLIK
jgi:GT2 family glycosyltransferase